MTSKPMCLNKNWKQKGSVSNYRNNNNEENSPEIPTFFCCGIQGHRSNRCWHDYYEDDANTDATDSSTEDFLKRCSGIHNVEILSTTLIKSNPNLL